MRGKYVCLGKIEDESWLCIHNPFPYVKLSLRIGLHWSQSFLTSFYLLRGTIGMPAVVVQFRLLLAREESYSNKFYDFFLKDICEKLVRLSSYMISRNWFRFSSASRVQQRVAWWRGSKCKTIMQILPSIIFEYLVFLWSHSLFNENEIITHVIFLSS